MTDVLLALLSLAVCSTLPFAAFGLGAESRGRAVGRAIPATAATIAPLLGFTLLVIAPLVLWLATGGDRCIRIFTQGLGALLVAVGVLGKERRYRRFRSEWRNVADRLARAWLKKQDTTIEPQPERLIRRSELGPSFAGDAPRGETLESRLRALEINLEASRREVRELKQQTESTERGLAKELVDVRTMAIADVVRVRQELIDSQVGSLHWEVLGFCWTLLALVFEARGL